jgi:hypothetical protein
VSQLPDESQAPWISISGGRPVAAASTMNLPLLTPPR